MERAGPENRQVPTLGISGAAWATALASRFSPTARASAAEFVDAVEAETDALGTVCARIKNGRNSFQVRIARAETDPQLALVSCTCESSTGQHRACKHVYAVLLAVDASRPSHESAPPRGLRVCDPNEEQLLMVGRRQLIGAPQIARVVAQEPRRVEPDWRIRKMGLSWPPTEVGRVVRSYPLQFVIRASPLATSSASESGWLTVSVATVRRGANGQVERRDGASDACLDDAADRKALDVLLGTQTFTKEIANGDAIGARVAPSRLDEVLTTLSATGKLGWLPRGGAVDLSPLRWDGQKAHALTLALSRAYSVGDRVIAYAFLVRDSERIPINAVTALAGANVVIVGDRLLRVDVAGLSSWWTYLQGGASVMRHDVREFLSDACSANNRISLDLSALGWTTESHDPQCRISLAFDADRTAFAASADMRYDGIPVRARSGTLIFDEPRVLRRQLQREQAALEQLRTIKGSTDEAWTVRVSELAAFVEAATQAGWEVWCERRRVNPPRRVSARVTSAIDWFDLAIDVESPSGSKATSSDLLSALRDGRNLVKLADGTSLVLPALLREWLDVLQSGTETREGIRFRAGDALAIGSFLERIADATSDESFRRLQQRIESVKQSPSDPPRAFRGTLLEYQRDGLGWLKSLRELGLGGCLADEMGLGKTVQVLAFLLDVHTGSWSRRPSLIVAPRSVVFQWLAEAKKFTPTLRVATCIDGATLATCDHDAYDVLLTTYGIVRTHQRTFERRGFDVVVLDEAHTIKSESAETTRACCTLRSSLRLALSGTPVENRIDDLQSIFGFLNPGLLSRPNAVSALGHASELERATALGSILRPVILRRTKDDVNAQLVPKYVQRIDCALNGSERATYDTLCAHYRQRITSGSSSGAVWKALSHLRQAALHPALVDPSHRDRGSAKLTALFQHLERIVASGERALVFSQYTRLLSLVRDQLRARGIEHEYLDGATNDRERRIDAFQRGSAPVFAISLKAGGTGLNLTAANHVFLLDPWWNPATEEQAIDRVHRPGQTRPVHAYRLVAVETIEEKVLALQEHKRTLVRSVFSANAEPRMSVELLRQLLA